MCIVVPPKRGRSQDTARQARGMRGKMVVLPMLARRAGTRYRVLGGSQQRVGLTTVVLRYYRLGVSIFNTVLRYGFSE